MALKQITPPAVEPVSLAEAKSHLRIFHDAEDTHIGLLIKAARQWLDAGEGWLGRALLQQTWQLHLDRFPEGDLRIPLPPLQSVTFVKYLDENGDTQTLDPLTYAVDTVNEPGWVLEPETGWPVTGDYPNAVWVEFVCGYADAAAVPSPIKMALLMVVSELYHNREESIVGTIVAKTTLGAERLLASYRVMEL